MKKFFCYGKKDFCTATGCDGKCPHYDGSGGKYLEAPMTNADRIRAMSDEELAKLLLDGCRGSKCNEQPQNEFVSVDCFQCRMEWLHRTAGDDEHESV